MKKFISLLFVFANFVCSAQNVIDTAYLQCTYEYKYVDDTIKMTTTTDNAMILLVGKKASAFYSYNTFLFDSLLNSKTDEEKWAMLANIGSLVDKNNRGESYKIYKNFADNRLVLTDKLIRFRYKYSEPLENQNWEITNETKKVQGYKCTKATCNFRGRNYEAWFTNEIAINNGPWKFGGLPGLIVKVHDTKNHFSFELYSVMKCKKEIAFNEKNYKEIKFSEYIKLLRMQIKDPMGISWAGVKYASNADVSKQPVFTMKYDVMERSE